MLRIQNILFQLFSSAQKSTMALTQHQAVFRSHSFAKDDIVRNTVHFELLKGKRYRALTKTIFNLVNVSPHIFLDWQGEKVQSINLNGVKLTQDELDVVSKDAKIFIPETSLKVGPNEITIKFENDYSTDGHGLHSFVDTDGLQYVYSQCEPYHASKMFPCFDQPDLKGTFKLYALAPNDWTVISNERRVQFSHHLLPDLQEHGIFHPIENYDLWEFDVTKPLSTYLYAILSGPYTEIPSPAQYIHNNIPMSIFCRASLLKYVQKDADEIFSLTSNGMKVYEELFGYPYPFGKYDQIFCPEYSTGAMENAGAVTLNDRYVFQEEVPKSERADRQNTILHELSHMWFGDLVTMKWWDDLWLNESFAEFISHFCMSKINSKEIEGVDVWVSFQERKIWGYVEDQLQTTHPIYCPIENTYQSENIFDGITYAKGASIIKQLFSMLGEATFSKAMKHYFNKYAFSNTILPNFFESLQFAVDQDQKQIDLNGFMIQWIMYAGLNTVRGEISGNTFIVHQGAALAEHPLLREQIFRVAFYNENAEIIAVKQIRLKPEPQTVLTFEDVQLENVKGFLLNYNDDSFVKTLYDNTQVGFLLKNISKLTPSLSRLLALRSIWDQVRDGQTCFVNFVDGIVGHLADGEPDDSISKMVFQWCFGGVGFYSPKKYRKGLKEKLAAAVAQLIVNTEANNKNRKLVLARFLAAWGESPQWLSELQKYLIAEDANSLPYGDLGIQNGWIIVNNIFAFTDLPIEEKWKLFEILAKRDGTDKVQNFRRFNTALLETDREKLWNYFIEYNNEESVMMVGEAMVGFSHDRHYDDLIKYEKPFFDVLPHIFKTKNNEYAKSFYHNLYPKGENIPYYQERITELLGLNLGNDVLTKCLRQSIDMEFRRQKAYATFPQE